MNFYDTESEKIVLSTMIWTEASCAYGLTYLRREDFFDTNNRIVFDVMNQLSKGNTAINYETISTKCKDLGNGAALNFKDFLVNADKWGFKALVSRLRNLSEIRE